MKHIQFMETGDPLEVAKIRELASGPPSAAEVRVRMDFAPINPADINYLQGTYGVTAQLPATPGIEGSGTIVETGAKVTSVSVGDRVILSNHIGSWSQELVLPEQNIIQVPKDLDPQQAAMLRANPPTAWLLIHGYTELQPGDWIVQNAANSAVGLALIQLAEALGFNTLNAVRSPQAEAVCRAHGARHVLLDDADFINKAQELLKAENASPPKLACNAVGGDSALRLMNVLADQGHHVTYGAMSRRSLKVPNKFLIFKRLHLQGLWVTKWMDSLTTGELQEILDRLANLMCSGDLRIPVDRTYPLDQIEDALAHAQQGSRSGKIMLDLRQ